MALLGSLIDARTVASFASNGSATFAHGLPTTPDIVLAMPNGAATSASGVIPIFTADATNVSLFGVGGQSAPQMKVVSIVFHSLVR
jgi:hypothetical protein